MATTKYYVVWKGRKTGIFSTWEACAVQVQGYPGAEYKAFANRRAAEAALKGQYEDYKGRPSSQGQWLFAMNPPETPSVCVDAAASGAPGPVEYRGVQTEDEKEIFRQGPFADGTNNVGEFLGIVHALAWLTDRRLDWPVYSDSENAIAWVNARKSRTRLKQTDRNYHLFELIARAESWLAENDYPNKVLKWDTQAWGEIPADFGRK